MNKRKPADYTALYATLDAILARADDLTQMELSHLIGQAIAARPEKGAAVIASEYIQQNHPDLSGFSPRTLRRMRDFYRAYENDPELMNQAMELNWSCNIVILEACESQDDRRHHIHAARRYGWSKSQLASAIAEGHCNETLPELEDENSAEESCNETMLDPNDGILLRKHTHAKTTHAENVYTRSIAANPTAPVVFNISPNSGHPAAPLVVKHLDNGTARTRKIRSRSSGLTIYNQIPPLLRPPHTALRHGNSLCHRWEKTQQGSVFSGKIFNPMNLQSCDSA